MDNFFIRMARDFIQQNVSSNDAVYCKCIIGGM